MEIAVEDLKAGDRFISEKNQLEYVCLSNDGTTVKLISNGLGLYEAAVTISTVDVLNRPIEGMENGS